MPNNELSKEELTQVKESAKWVLSQLKKDKIDWPLADIERMIVELYLQERNKPRTNQEPRKSIDNRRGGQASEGAGTTQPTPVKPTEEPWID